MDIKMHATMYCKSYQSIDVEASSKRSQASVILIFFFLFDSFGFVRRSFLLTITNALLTRCHIDRNSFKPAKYFFDDQRDAQRYKDDPLHAVPTGEGRSSLCVGPSSNLGLSYCPPMTFNFSSSSSISITEWLLKSEKRRRFLLSFNGLSAATTLKGNLIFLTGFKQVT